MKSESQIRRQIVESRNVLARPKSETGIRERAAAEAVIGSLQWVVNKDGYQPESHIMDAMIDDNSSPDVYEIIEAVANIGVDFGYGEFQLDESHIKKARHIMESHRG